jgi:4-amino-4-deoxy-L-arabinose transferase-like glycosyltransferase
LSAYSSENHSPSGTLLLASALFLLALLTRLLFYFLNPDLNFFQVSVFGVPFSDAKGWNDLAVSIAEGRGMIGEFGGQRPLYPFLLACIYALLGTSFETGKLLNVLASSLFVPFVYLIVEKIFNRLIGLFVALFLILERGQLAFSLTMMSEPTGALFFALSFYLLFVALERRKTFAFFMSGLLLSLSNLSRPLTLFCALPFSAFIYYLLRKQSAGSRMIVRSLLLFVLGFALVLTPWIVRQKAVHGILTISDKTADSFYAVTSPEFKFWTQEVDSEMLRLGIKEIREKNRYLMRKGFENLSEHPWFFLRNVSSIFFSYVKGFYVKEWAFISLTPVFIFYLFFLAPLRQRGTGRKAIMALLGGCAVTFQVLTGPISHGITLAGMAFSLIWTKNRHPFVLAGAFIFSGIFLSIGASPSLIYRSTMLVGWIFLAYHLLFYTCLFGWAQRWVFRDQTSLPDSTLPFSSYLEERSGPAARVIMSIVKGFACCIVLFFIVAGTRIAYLNFFAHNPEDAHPVLSVSEQRMIVRSVVQRFPDAFSEGERSGEADIVGNADMLSLDGRAHRKLLVGAGKVTPYIYRVPGFLDLDHMCRIFFPRAYDRTVMMVEDVGYCILPNRVPENMVGKHVVVVGRLDFRPEVIYEGRTVVEGIAVLPWDPNQRRLGTAPLIANHEVHQVVLRLLKPPH